MERKVTEEVKFVCSDGNFTHKQWEEDGIVYGVEEGFLDIEAVEKWVEVIKDFHEKLGKNYLFLMDINKMPDASPEARKKVTAKKKPAPKKKTTTVKKTAPKRKTTAVKKPAAKRKTTAKKKPKSLP